MKTNSNKIPRGITPSEESVLKRKRVSKQLHKTNCILKMKVAKRLA